MRMLIAAAALIVAGGTAALAEEPACGQTKDAALVEARTVAQSVKGEVIEIADAALAQKAADQIFDALGKPHQPISAMIILKVPGGASLAALYGPTGCFVVGVRVPTSMLIEMIGRSA